MGLHYNITFNHSDTRRYLELVSEFNSVLEDLVNEILCDADRNDRVGFTIPRILRISKLTVR